MVRSNRNSILGAIIMIVLALLILWLNPIQNLTKYVGEDIYMRSIAAAYPVNRPNTLLVLADDGTLQASARGQVPRGWARWPLPLTAWAAALDEAQARQAGMVLLDIGFVDRRNVREEYALLTSVKLVSETTDIFIVDPGLRVQGETLAAWLVRRAGSERVRLVSPERAAASGIATPYLLRPKQLRSPIAAVAMAQTYCRRARTPCGSGVSAEPVIELWWPLPECLPTAALPRPCGSPFPAAVARMSAIIIAQTFSGVCENVPKLFLCASLASPTIAGFAVPKVALEEFVMDRAGAPPGPPPDAVIIGQDFDMAQDLARSSVYGATPGAHAQAVAFDNLSTLGQSVITRRYPWGLSEHMFLSFLIIVTVICVHLLRGGMRVVIARAGSNGEVPRLVERIINTVDRRAAGIVLATTLLGFFSFCFTHAVTPANWIAAYGALGIVSTEESRVECHVRNLLVRFVASRQRTIGTRIFLGLARRR